MIDATISGDETVSYDGSAWVGPNAMGDCCRALIGRGLDPGTRIVFRRHGEMAIAGSLAAFADRSYPSGEAKSVRWQPHPKGTYPDALLAWGASRPSRSP